MRIISIAAAALLATTMVASAQPLAEQSLTGVNMRVTANSSTRLGSDYDPGAARDGCINYPGQAHNSADCGRILAWDPSWVVPNKPLTEMTGAEENMVRTYNLLAPKPGSKPAP